MNNECVSLFCKLYSYGVCSNVYNYYELYLINGSMYKYKYMYMEAFDIFTRVKFQSNLNSVYDSCI